MDMVSRIPRVRCCIFPTFLWLFPPVFSIRSYFIENNIFFILLMIRSDLTLSILIRSCTQLLSHLMMVSVSVLERLFVSMTLPDFLMDKILTINLRQIMWHVLCPVFIFCINRDSFLICSQYLSLFLFSCFCFFNLFIFCLSYSFHFICLF